MRSSRWKGRPGKPEAAFLAEDAMLLLIGNDPRRAVLEAVDDR